jgi:hypothetical protein
MPDDADNDEEGAAPSSPGDNGDEEEQGEHTEATRPGRTHPRKHSAAAKPEEKTPKKKGGGGGGGGGGTKPAKSDAKISGGKKSFYADGVGSLLAAAGVSADAVESRTAAGVCADAGGAIGSWRSSAARFAAERLRTVTLNHKP